MSFLLPPQDHKARDLIGDLATIAVILDPANASRLPSTVEALRQAERMFSSSDRCAVKRVAIVVIRADSDERWLISVGERGGWRREWNFGNGEGR